MEAASQFSVNYPRGNIHSLEWVVGWVGGGGVGGGRGFSTTHLLLISFFLFLFKSNFEGEVPMLRLSEAGTKLGN